MNERKGEFGFFQEAGEKIRNTILQAPTYARQLKEEIGIGTTLKHIAIPAIGLGLVVIAGVDMGKDLLRGYPLEEAGHPFWFPVLTVAMLAYAIQIAVDPWYRRGSQ